MNTKKLEQIKYIDNNKGNFIYTPGPTMVPTRVLNAMSRQIINPDLDPYES